VAAKYIAIEGPIGVGKTTLAKMLANHYDGRLTLEKHDDNPFLEDFYKDRERYAFQVQLFFLLSRFRQQQDYFSGDLLDSYIISDYFFGKDRIFADFNLNQDELILYDHIASLYEKNIPLPDLIIYLTAPTGILMERIKKRGRGYEKHIDYDYLDSINESYRKYFFHFHQTPLLVINTEHVNFDSESDQFKYLIERIENLKSGTSYLVPSGEE